MTELTFDITTPDPSSSLLDLFDDFQLRERPYGGMFTARLLADGSTWRYRYLHDDLLSTLDRMLEDARRVITS